MEIFMTMQPVAAIERPSDDGPARPGGTPRQVVVALAVALAVAVALGGIGAAAAAAVAATHLGAPKHLRVAPKHLSLAPKHLSLAPKHLGPPTGSTTSTAQRGDVAWLGPAA